MRSNQLSIGQRVEHWLHTYSRLRKAHTTRSARSGLSATGEASPQSDVLGNDPSTPQANWQTLTEGFRTDRLKATQEFLARQQYYRIIRRSDTGEWMQSEEVEVAPTLDLGDLYARLDSSASAEGLSAEGLALTLVVIDENGTPREASIHESEHRLLNTKALYTAMRTRFAPAYHYGIPVGTIVIIPMYFQCQM